MIQKAKEKLNMTLEAEEELCMIKEVEEKLSMHPGGQGEDITSDIT